jgi:ornithine cyclodeaminase
VLRDADVESELSPGEAVKTARGAVIAAYRRELAAPARIQADAGDTTYVFTVGGRAGGPSGFRAYGLWPNGGDQIVAVWQPDGSLAGVVVGNALGAYRTGALGGVAVDALAAPDATVCMLIGAGAQTWTQIWAISAVRPLTDIRVMCRTAATREALAARITRDLGVRARPVAGPQEALAGAEVVVTATTSRSPVIETRWPARGCHVNAVGPKFRNGSGVPSALGDIASVVVSDSPE